MYVVHLINMGYDEGIYESAREALAAARDTGLESVVFCNKEHYLVATYSPVRGFSNPYGRETGIAKKEVA